LSDVLKLEELSHGKVSIVHKGRQLRLTASELLNDSGPIHDLGVRYVGQKLIDVVGSKCHVPFTEQRESGVRRRRRLRKGAMNALSIARPAVADDNGASSGGS
jgi:hypothetical protein